MKIVIAGGSGQVGTVLARAFHTEGHEVVVLSREPQDRPWGMRYWDGATLGEWTEEVDGSDAVINLTGRNVNCRYNARNRREILESRVASTRVIGTAIQQARRPPRVWLQASTATIYGHRYDAANDEASGVIGGSEPGAPADWTFSTDVARAWEQTFDEAVTPSTRKVAMRSAMIMSPDRGGIFDTLLTLVRRGLGGSAGDGRQFMSWIHWEDFVRAVSWLLDHERMSGVVNVCSPYPLPNADFMRILRQSAGVSIGLPATRWMLALGAIVMRTETELILKSRRVVPGRLQQSGFTFLHAHWPEAARDLCTRRTTAVTDTDAARKRHEARLDRTRAARVAAADAGGDGPRHRADAPARAAGG